MTEFADNRATIRLMSTTQDFAAAPIDVLVKILEGVQRIVYLIADAQHTKDRNGVRFRPSASVEKRYMLWALPATKGSYQVDLELPPPSDQLLIIPTDDVMERLGQVMESLSKNNMSEITKVVGTPWHASRAIATARNFSPSNDDDWYINFSNGKHQNVRLGKGVRHEIDQWMMESGRSTDEILTITGELTAIDFDRHQLTLKYPPTKREILCTYLAEIEEEILDNRRDMIQVTGHFVLNDSGHPEKMTEVSKIEPLDLSPIVIKGFEWRGRKFTLVKPLSLTPELDETKQLLWVEHPLIGLDVFARTRDDLTNEIFEQLSMLWDEFAMANEDELTESAAKVREQLRISMKDASDAA